jgi:hypothetical protein
MFFAIFDGFHFYLLFWVWMICGGVENHKDRQFGEDVD